MQCKTADRRIDSYASERLANTVHQVEALLYASIGVTMQAINSGCEQHPPANTKC